MPDQEEPTSPGRAPEPDAQPESASAATPIVRKFATAEEAKAAMDALVNERWEAKKRGLAPHEAAHAVVSDDMGYRVIDVNIARGKDQKASIDWKGLGQLLPTVNWGDPAAVAAIGPKFWDLVTNYVAGRLAEAEGKHSEEKKISDRTTPELLAAGQFGPADLNATCHYLKRIGRNTQADVMAAEARAREILQRRADDHKALTKRLLEVEFLAGEELQKFLGH